jgi:hypothetical protein
MIQTLETAALQAMVDAEHDVKWKAITIGFLRVNEREIAVGKIANALVCHVYDQNPPSDPLASRLYTEALKRIDFFSCALRLVQTAEAADPSLVRVSESELEAA